MSRYGSLININPSALKKQGGKISGERKWEKEIEDKRKTFLIHSADPQLRPVAIIVFIHVVRTSVRTSVRPHFQKLAKKNIFPVKKTMFTTGETVGLAEWIIDDTCLVSIVEKRLILFFSAILTFFTNGDSRWEK